MPRWTHSDIPSQDGRIAIVTGTGGLGYETALALARAGAEVILAGRNPDKGFEALRRIRDAATDATISFEMLDLADLASVAAFAERLERQRNRIDLLVNNAGVMTPPRRKVTADGFELQLGTNYLGHFALTGRLLPLLCNGQDARVVTLSSVAAPGGKIDFADLNAKKRYKAGEVYAQSKLACMMFAFELQRRSEAAGWPIRSMAAHPGISRTDLLPNGAGPASIPGLLRSTLPFLFQPAAQGALPTLYAATAPQAEGGAYYGPDSWAGMRGYPTLAKIPQQAQDGAVAKRLWTVSEAMTGVRFGQPALIATGGQAAHG
ncbi:oxidoreductase [Croceibacterium ferulae]|uniref:oxidoreductase n=1 Tax=Croceibacterium ferulae TaxID=1854641 RepID=UPI000EAF48FB|nr:oxidoreductase [Croceibacterium ferulae]